MAYTNSPTNSTYKTVRLDFTAMSNNRVAENTLLAAQDDEGTRDAGILNMYYDRVSNENKERWVGLKKRQGLSDTDIEASAFVDILGHLYDEDTRVLYWADSTNVYLYDFFNGVGPTIIETWATPANVVGFCSFLKATTGAKFIIYTNGTEMFTWNGATSTAVSDPQLPTPHQPSPVYLDNFLFIIKSDTGDIYNSDFDDPTSWTAGNYISTEINADYARKLVKVKNYLICFGFESIEYFYNGGIESGSPLIRNDAYTKKIGYIAGLAQWEDKIIFVGNPPGLPGRVYILDGETVKSVSNKYVNQALNRPVNYFDFALGYDTPGNLIAMDGHVFYVIDIAFSTFVLDLDNGLWYNWGYAGREGMRISLAVTVEDLTTNQTRTLIKRGNNTVFEEFLATNYMDGFFDIVCMYTTNSFNAGTQNWKSCPRVSVITDRGQRPGTSEITLDLAWSDNDWLDAPTYRTININSDNPYLWQTGRFRNRSWKVKYQKNTPLRLYGLEMDLNVGNR